jgi:hypothetical protein
LDLDAIAAQTKINARLLESIEAGQLEEIPGTFFRRSFLRQYATVLGMDWSEIEADLAGVLEPEAAAPIAPEEAAEETKPASKAYFPPPVRITEHHKSAATRIVLSFVVCVLVMLGCSVVYSVWQRFHSAVGPNEPIIVQQPAATPEPPQRAQQEVNQASQPKAGIASLELTATQETWVSVAAGGRTVFMGVLKPNETKGLEGIQNARLLVGNAGGLQVHWKGKLLGPFGPSGQVRIVDLTPEGFQVSLTHKAEKEGSQL